MRPWRFPNLRALPLFESAGFGRSRLLSTKTNRMLVRMRWNSILDLAGQHLLSDSFRNAANERQERALGDPNLR